MFCALLTHWFSKQALVNSYLTIKMASSLTANELNNACYTKYDRNLLKIIGILLICMAKVCFGSDYFDIVQLA
jgi:hypothetical protein